MSAGTPGGYCFSQFRSKSVLLAMRYAIFMRYAQLLTGSGRPRLIVAARAKKNLVRVYSISGRGQQCWRPAGVNLRLRLHPSYSYAGLAPGSRLITWSRIDENLAMV